MPADFDLEDNSFTAGLLRRLLFPLVGVFLFLMSFVLLWTNEGNILAEKEALTEMSQTFVPGQAEKPLPEHNEKLVHVTGELNAASYLGDPPFLNAGPWLAIDRDVEMFQWIQHEETNNYGDYTETTYSYRQGWANGRIDSATFHDSRGHENPPLPLEAKKLYASQTKLGAYEGASALERISERKPLLLKKALLNKFNTSKLDLGRARLEEGELYFQREQRPKDASPQLGDIRVSYQVLEPGLFSVLALQKTGDKLVPHTAKNGKEHFLVAAGTKPAEAMIEQASQDASVEAMIARFAGFAMMWLGLYLIANCMHVLERIPFLPKITHVSFFITGAVSFALSISTMLISMIAHHPVLLAITLMGAGGSLVYLFLRSKERKLLPTTTFTASPDSSFSSRPAAIDGTSLKPPTAGKETNAA